MNLNQVFDIGKGAAHAITGLEYHRVGKTDTYFVVATTVDRLYHFIGHSSNSEERPLLQNLFNKYLGLQGMFEFKVLFFFFCFYATFFMIWNINFGGLKRY